MERAFDLMERAQIYCTNYGSQLHIGHDGLRHLDAISSIRWVVFQHAEVNFQRLNQHTHRSFQSALMNLTDSSTSISITHVK